MITKDYGWTAGRVEVGRFMIISFRIKRNYAHIKNKQNTLPRPVELILMVC